MYVEVLVEEAIDGGSSGLPDQGASSRAGPLLLVLLIFLSLPPVPPTLLTLPLHLLLLSLPPMPSPPRSCLLLFLLGPKHYSCSCKGTAYREVAAASAPTPTAATAAIGI